MCDFSLGCLVDLRSDQRRAHLAAGPHGDFELMAARVVSRLTGEPVVIQDDGSKAAMPDPRIDYRSRESAYVEAVVDVDTSYASMAAQIWSQPSLPASRLWTVHITGSSPRLSQLRRRLPKLLGDLTTPLTPDLKRELEALGLRVSGPWEPPAGEPGAIHLRPEGTFGQTGISWDALLDWADHFLSASRTEDVRRKLAAASAGERHAFVAVSFTSPGDLVHKPRRRLPRAAPRRSAGPAATGTSPAPGNHPPLGVVGTRDNPLPGMVSPSGLV